MRLAASATTWVLFTMLALAGAVQAETAMTARVDGEVVSLDDTVQLTVSISGAGLGAGEPTLPSLNGFRIVGTSTQQSLSLVGASMQSSTDYVYELQPLKAGTLTIGAVHYKNLSTPPITVIVTRGSGRSRQPLIPQPGNPFGEPPPGEPVPPKEAAQVRQTANPKSAYVGQQITYTFSFYQAEQLYGDASHNPADTPGFVAESLPNPPQATETLNGRLYQVQRRQKALFANVPGKHVIGQSSVTVALDPLSGPQDLVAKPITIQILPLPSNGRPANFGGAVGTFTVRTAIDRNVVRAGETVNLSVEIRGNGNIRTLGAPQLRLPEWVRTYKSGEKRNTSAGGGGGGPSVMGGTATFQYLLLPKQAGEFTIPSLAYPYFDPRTRSYRTASSQPLQVTVAPGSAVAADQPLPTNGLRPLKATLGRSITRPLPLQGWFWVIMAIPLLLVLAAGWRRWQQWRLSADPAHARSESALSLARHRFDAACKSLAGGDQDRCYLELNAALADYIADRTGAPPSGLTADQAYTLLIAHGAEEPAAAQARDLLARTAAGRFAPGGAAVSAQQLAEQCRQLVEQLQRQVRPSS
jgi:hypothetical protein